MMPALEKIDITPVIDAIIKVMQSVQGSHRSGKAGCSPSF
jgi:hypothetical protein